MVNKYLRNAAIRVVQLQLCKNGMGSRNSSRMRAVHSKAVNPFYFSTNKTFDTPMGS